MVSNVKLIRTERKIGRSLKLLNARKQWQLMHQVMSSTPFKPNLVFALPYEVVVSNLIQSANLSGFKRRATAMFKSNSVRNDRSSTFEYRPNTHDFYFLDILQYLWKSAQCNMEILRQ